MIARIVAVSLFLPACSMSAAADNAPAQLRSKSVLVSWTENRNQREVGLGDWRSISNSVDQTLYISSVGRIFRRQHRTSFGSGGRSGVRSNTFERAPGESRLAGVVAGGTRFSGTTTTQTGVYQAGARQLIVSFDSSFTTCSARIIQGREGGKNQIMISQITGRKLEVRSVEIVSPRCSVRDGNALAQ